VSYLKKNDSKFSLAFFSRRLKVSDAYLKLVVQGRRNLDLDKAFKLGTAINLSPSERVYFVGLVLENQARDVGLRRVFRSQLQNLAKNKFSYSEKQKWSVIFEDALAWEVFSLIGIDDFKSDPTWIVKKLKNKGATESSVSQVITKLLELEAVERDSSGKLKAKDIVIPRRFSPSRAYMTALNRAQVHLSQGLVDSSYFDSLCVIVNSEQLSELKAVLEETKRKVSEIVTSGKGAKTHIAYVNTNLFLASN